MENNSSGEELSVKVRKPYTITKQREKWTEEEHNKFLEALKLYGRAWQRIEEHIGTKTAVQIRSHAQKFFTKLEKEALAKGVSPGQAHDIDIPPPRPKRKPISPYPRKTGIASISLNGETTSKQLYRPSPIQGMKTQPVGIESNLSQEKLATTKNFQDKDAYEDGSCSEVINTLQDAPSGFISCTNKSSSNHCKLMEFLTTKEKVKDKNAATKASALLKVNKGINKSETDSTVHENEESTQNFLSSQINIAKENGFTSNSKENVIVHHFKEAPFKFMDTTGGKDAQASHIDGQSSPAMNSEDGGNSSCSPSKNPTGSGIPEIHNTSSSCFMHQQLPPFSPFTQWQNHPDAYRSFLDTSSTFSHLIVSTLLQNPAVHAAAVMAASFWPSAASATSIHSAPQMVTGEVPESHMNPSPSMTAIAAATIAAAAAWWATQGLMPWFPHFGYAFAPETTTPMSDTGAMGNKVDFHGPENENNLTDNVNQPETLNPQHESPQSLQSSSSDSDDSGRVNNSNCTEDKATRPNQTKSLETGATLDCEKVKSKKTQYRSSCGSNTPSSSDIETENILKKNEKVSDDVKEDYFDNSSAVETNHRRFKSCASTTESWREVSEEGRLAFQALFKRDVLPQSFSPPHTEEATKKSSNEVSSLFPVDLKMNGDFAADQNNVRHHMMEEKTLKTGDGGEQVLLINQFGDGKLKARRTGFKPYKRCSIEAKENKGATEDSSNKRIRLHGGASS